MKNTFSTQLRTRYASVRAELRRQRDLLRVISVILVALLANAGFTIQNSYSADETMRGSATSSRIEMKSIKSAPPASGLILGSIRSSTLKPYLQTITPAECYISSSTWQNDPLAVQVSPFVAQFDMTPNTADMDGVTGLSLNPALYYNDLAAIVRFNVTGFMDAIDGDNYRAETALPYSPGLTYHFRLIIYPVSHLYTIYVTSPSSAETVLGSNFRFRSSQSSTSSLNYWSLFAEKPSHTVCGFGATAFGSSDTSAPTASITDPLVNATVSGTVNISANAADDIGVVGVQLKADGKPVGNELSAMPYVRSWDTGAVPNGTHILTATARDAAGNAITSAPVTVTVNNVPTTAACPMSSSIWQNQPIAEQAAQFQATFDATPNLANMDGHAGFSLGTADALPRLAVDARFNSSGFIDARNGGTFAASTSVSYLPGQKYHFRLIVDPSAHTYTIFVTPPGSSEITLGTNFAFQINFSRLNNWVLYSAVGSLSICNFAAGPVGPPPDFSLFAAPSSQTVTAGNSAIYTVSVGSLNSFSGSVNLNASGLPAGAVASFMPATVTGSGNSQLTITTTDKTPAGSHTITISGTSGSGTHSTTSTLMVAAALKSIVVTPSNSSTLAGGKLQFHATGTYSDSTTKDLTASSTWTSSNTTTATISASGLATAGTAGKTTTISAAFGTISGSTTLTVTSGMTVYETESSTVFNASKSSGPAYRVFTWWGFTDSQGTTLDANAAGQFVTITLNVPQAGIYDVKFATKTHSTRGIVQLTVKGAKLGPAVDEYSAGDVWKVFDLGTVSLAAGNVPFVFTSTDKNSASSGFTQAFDYIKLSQQ